MFHRYIFELQRPNIKKLIKNILRFLNIIYISIFFLFPSFSLAYEQNPKLWVQVPQWENDWSECAVDIPDTSCH